MVNTQDTIHIELWFAKAFSVLCEVRDSGLCFYAVSKTRTIDPDLF